METNIQTENIQEEQAQKNPIMDILNTLWQRRKVFYWLWPITFVLSAALILCVPRYYTVEVVLAPESQSAGGSGSLQALASSFGFDSRSMTGGDALYPLIYPEIVKSPNFLISLFEIPVTTAEDDFSGTFYKYLLKKNKSAFWKRWKGKIRALISPTEEAPKIKREGVDGVDVFVMDKWQWYAVELMRKNIKCSIDKKTEVITLSITTQDKLVSATMADSVCVALQNFITEYRTAKNRTDLRFYEQVMRDSYQEYQEACDRYIRYADGHRNTNLEQYRIEAQNLETEMDLKRSAFTSFQKQFLTTQARLQENTPVFTVLQSASVPLKATGPRRVLFVIAMLIFITGIACCWLCKDQLMALLMSKEDE